MRFKHFSVVSAALALIFGAGALLPSGNLRSRRLLSPVSILKQEAVFRPDPLASRREKSSKQSFIKEDLLVLESLAEYATLLLGTVYLAKTHGLTFRLWLERFLTESGPWEKGALVYTAVAAALSLVILSIMEWKKSDHPLLFVLVAATLTAVLWIAIPVAVASGIAPSRSSP